MQLDSVDEPKSSDNWHRPIGLQTGDVSEVDLMSFEVRIHNSLWTLKSSNLTTERLKCQNVPSSGTCLEITFAQASVFLVPICSSDAPFAF
ncbi:unnamed protein product [Sphagnum jensenii]|uniref:Uncharacterized protein n=1 Tax=Sphagnum jensenii TaxID=128206 RepID=A0ABP1AME0_9BRYO